MGAQLCLNRARRPGEPAEEAERKRLLLLPAVFWAIFCLRGTIVYARQAAAWSAAGGDGRAAPEDTPCFNWFSTWFGLVAFSLWATFVLVTRSLSIRAVDVCAMMCIPCVIGSDWGAAQTGNGEAWAYGVLVLDILLTTQGSEAVTRGCLTTLVVWVVVRSVEDALRFGLWDFPYHTGRAAEARGAGVLPNLLARRLAPFLIDFWFTRRFAQQMRSSVALAGAVARALAGYDLDAAQDALEGKDGRALPADMHAAFNTLIHNLATYKPFLPQSCLPQEGGGDGVRDSSGESEVLPVTPPNGFLPRPCEAPAEGGGGGGGGGGGDEGAEGPRPAASQSPRNVSSPLIMRMATLELATPVTQSFNRFQSVQSMKAGGQPPPASPTVCSQLVCSLRASHSQRWRPGAVQRGSVGSSKPGGRQSPRTSASWGPSRPHSSRHAPPPCTEGALRGAAARARLKRKMATLLAVNVRGYLTFARAARTSVMLDLHNGLLEGLMAAAEGNKGLTDGVSGDRFYASVNGPKTAVAHRIAGVRLAWYVTAARGVDVRQWVPDAELSAAVCSGELVCGNLGCAKLLRYSFVGDVAAWVHVIERLTARWEAAAAVNAPVKQDAETSFYFRLRAVARMAKKSYAERAPSHVWEIIAQQTEQEGDEWLYQIQQGEAANAWLYFNLAHAAFFSGEHAAAEEHIAEGRRALRAAAGERAALEAAYDELGRAAAQRPERPVCELRECEMGEAAPRHNGGDGGTCAAPAAAPAAPTAAAVVSEMHAAQAWFQQVRTDDKERQQRSIMQSVAKRKDRAGAKEAGAAHGGAEGVAQSLGGEDGGDGGVMHSEPQQQQQQHCQQ